MFPDGQMSSAEAGEMVQINTQDGQKLKDRSDIGVSKDKRVKTKNAGPEEDISH